jgi:hypothetical protein
MSASPEDVEKEEGIIQVDMDQINHQDRTTQLDQHVDPSHSFQQRKTSCQIILQYRLCFSIMTKPFRSHMDFLDNLSSLQMTNKPT